MLLQNVSKLLSVHISLSLPLHSGSLPEWCLSNAGSIHAHSLEAFASQRRKLEIVTMSNHIYLLFYLFYGVNYMSSQSRSFTRDACRESGRIVLVEGSKSSRCCIMPVLNGNTVTRRCWKLWENSRCRRILFGSAQHNPCLTIGHRELCDDHHHNSM